MTVCVWQHAYKKSTPLQVRGISGPFWHLYFKLEFKCTDIWIWFFLSKFWNSDVCRTGWLSQPPHHYIVCNQLKSLQITTSITEWNKGEFKLSKVKIAYDTTWTLHNQHSRVTCKSTWKVSSKTVMKKTTYRLNFFITRCLSGTCGQLAQCLQVTCKC